MTYRSVVKEDAPLFYMPMDGGDSAVNDGSVSLTRITSNVSGTDSGMAGEAVVFSASNAHIQYRHATQVPINDGTWSIELWFKKANAGDTGYMELLNHYDSNNEVVIYGSANNKKVECWFKSNGGARKKMIGPEINDTNWHHVVVTSDGTTARLYVDATEVATGTGATANYATNQSWWIGAYGSAAGNENWQGTIDEFAVYTTTLSSGRVTAHYNEGISPSPAPVVFRGWGIPL